MICKLWPISTIEVCAFIALDVTLGEGGICTFSYKTMSIHMDYYIYGWVKERGSTTINSGPPCPPSIHRIVAPLNNINWFLKHAKQFKS